MTEELLAKTLKKQTKAELIELLIKIHHNGDKKTKEIIEADENESRKYFSAGDIVKLIVIRPLRTALQCKILGTGEKVTFRKNRMEIPGETITVEVS